MQLNDFKLERFFARYEFKAPYLLCCSDCEAMTIQDLLNLQEGSQEEFLQTWLGYTESTGSPELREQVASLYQNIAPDQVLVHTGAEEAIHNFVISQLQAGDHVIVQTPCYQSLLELPRACGGIVSPWPLHPTADGWEADLGELKNLINKNTRLIIINSPHNPTGHMFSLDQWQEIMRLAAGQDILLFADEVYKYLEYNQQPLPWACDLYDHAVSLGVLSKSFGLPGLRIGWIATRNHNIYQAMARQKDYTTICNSAPSEYLATLAIRNRAAILERNRNLITGNLRLLDEFFQRHEEHFSWLRPSAGPIAFPAFKESTSATGYAEKLVEQAGILLLPGSCYDYGDRHFRIGFGRANLAVVLARWEEWLDKQAR